MSRPSWSSAAGPTSRSPRCARLVADRTRTIVLAGTRAGEAGAARPRSSCAARRHHASRRVRVRRRGDRHPTRRSSTTSSSASATSTSSLVAFGVLGDQDRGRADAAAAAEIARPTTSARCRSSVPLAQPHARAGPRRDRRAVVGRRRAGPPVELRLRLVEGRARRVLPGARRQPRRAPACASWSSAPASCTRR